MKCTVILLFFIVAFFSESVNSQLPLPLNPLKAMSQLNPLNIVPELNPLKIVENVQDMADLTLNGNFMSVIIKNIAIMVARVTGMSLSELKDLLLNGVTQACDTIETFLENMQTDSENEFLDSVIVIQKKGCSSIISVIENINAGEKKKKKY